MFAQSPGGLPAPWSAQDIGSPAVAGGVTFEEDRFTIRAAGRDIWDQSDQFHFLYQQVTGDVDIKARVDSLELTNSWAKAGVMVRSSLDPTAAHAFALVSAANGVAFQRRTQSGAASLHTAGPASAPPRWVRLIRAGTTVSAFSSVDGLTWSSISSSSIALGATAYVGVAVTSHNTEAATTAVVSQVAVVPLTLPDTYQSADIGAPALQGSVSYREGAYTVRAGGTDIWNTSDQFHFVFQQVAGDVEVIARVQSLTNTHGWAKAGVMIRESLDAASRHAAALSTYAYGYKFQRRADTGALSVSTAGPAAGRPGWVRLVRAGSQIEAFHSVDGTDWTSIGIDTIPMGETVYVGIAVTSHNTSRTTEAVLDRLTVAPAGSASNEPPLVALTAPADGATIDEGADLTLSASASDGDGTIARVDFFAGSTLVGSDTTEPYTVTWQAVPAGTYAVTAVAVDSDGAGTTSASVTVSATAPVNQPPSVTLTAPANSATFTAPATIALTATASDPENALARVEFYSGTTLLATDTAAPYAFTWSSVAAGTYDVRAVAYDTADASASSAVSTITVTTPTTGPPTGVAFLASTDHAALVTRYELRIFAGGADPQTATPLAVSDLAKPTPDANGEITIDRAALFSSLAAGDYVAAVSAVGSGGISTSTGVAFSR